MKRHCLSIRQSLLLMAAAVPSMIGGCSCYGTDYVTLFPECGSFGDYLQYTQLESCIFPQLIGKNNTAAIFAVPFAKPVSDENQNYYSVTTQIISVATNGSSELIRELDFFLSTTIVSNGEYIAWVTRDPNRVMVINRTSPDPWTALELPSPDGAFLGLAGTRLGIGISSTSTIVVVDVAERRKILQVDNNYNSQNTPGNAYWAISNDWLVSYELKGATINRHLLKRYSLVDSSVTVVTQIGPFEDNLVIDSEDNSVYWPESEPPGDHFINGATRLMRWNSTNNQQEVRDSQFVEEYSPPPFYSGLRDDRILSEAVDGTLLGVQFDNGSIYYFVRQPDDSERRVLIGSQYYWYPLTLVNNHIVWLDTNRRKVVIFDPQSQNTSEVDLPQ